MEQHEDDILFLSGFEIERWTEELLSRHSIRDESFSQGLSWQLLATLREAGAEVHNHSLLFATSMLLANPIGYYSVNVKKTIWTALGLILDIKLTMGAASALLAALGVIGQTIGKVHEENGELCILRFCLAAGTPNTSDSILASLRNACFKEKSACKYRLSDGCSIPDAAIHDGLGQLERIGAMARTTEYKWRPEF
jgi:hypothetical protein